MDHYTEWIGKEQKWVDDMVRAAANRTRKYALLVIPGAALALGLINLLCGGSPQDVLRVMLYGLIFGIVCALLILLLVRKPSGAAYMDALKAQAETFSPEQREEMALQLMSADAVCIQYKGEDCPTERTIATKEYFFSSLCNSPSLCPLLLKTDQISQILTDTKDASFVARSHGMKIRVQDEYYTIEFRLYEDVPALPQDVVPVITLKNKDLRDQIVASIQKYSS